MLKSGMGGSGTNDYVPRVTQLDALELDQDVVRILKDQLINTTKFSGSRYLTKWEPELELLLKLLIWKFSVVKTHSTFGQQLLGIKYESEYSKKKVWLMAFITFGAKYLQTRSVEISNVSSNRSTKDTIHMITRHVETGVQILSLLNFLIFLRNGKYPTLAHRFLRLTLVPINPGKSRSIGYSYMTRELLWHGFIELLVFTLPLINYYYIKRRILSFFGGKALPSATDFQFTTETACPLCGKSPILPQSIGCVHVYCYYCVKAHLVADPQFECVVCGYGSQGEVKAVKM